MHSLYHRNFNLFLEFYSGTWKYVRFFLKRSSQKHCTWNNVSVYILHSWRFFLCRFGGFFLFFFMLVLWRPYQHCALVYVSCLKKIKVWLSPQLFHQYQQDVYKPWFMLGIPRREHRLTVLSNKQSQQHFSYGKLIKELWASCHRKENPTGLPTFNRQEADCRTLSGFLTLFYVQ